MGIQYFKLICPICDGEGDLMSCVQKEEKLIEMTYVCPSCGHSDIKIHYLYRD